jgi:rubrerythrin
MLAELVKVLEEKKAALESEQAALQEKQPGRDAEELQRRISLINDQTIKGYKILWKTFTPPNPFPCPFCFVFHRKVSPLKPQSLVGDMEPFKCPECKETFEIPVELF